MIGRRVVRSTRSSLESSVEVLPPEKHSVPPRNAEQLLQQPTEFQRQDSLSSSIGRRLSECARALRNQSDSAIKSSCSSSSNITARKIDHEDSSNEDDNEIEDLPNGVELQDLEEFESLDDPPVQKCESSTPKLTRKDVESIQDLRTIEFLVRNSQTLSRYMSLATSPQGLSSAASSSNTFEFEDRTFLTTINRAQFVSMTPRTDVSAATPSSGMNPGIPSKTGLPDSDDDEDEEDGEMSLEKLWEESDNCIESNLQSIHQSLESKKSKEFNRGNHEEHSNMVFAPPRSNVFNSFFDKDKIDAGPEPPRSKKALASKPPRNPVVLKQKMIPEEQEKQIQALLENSRYDTTEAIQLQDGEGFSISSEQLSRIAEIHSRLKQLRPEIKCWDTFLNPASESVATISEKHDTNASASSQQSTGGEANPTKTTEDTERVLLKQQKRKANQWLVQARLQRAERERLVAINSKLKELYQQEKYISEGDLTSEQLSQLLESCRKEQQRVPCEPYNSNSCNIVCISPQAPVPLQSDLPLFLEESGEADLSSRIADAQCKHAMKLASRFDAEEEMFALSSSTSAFDELCDETFSPNQATLTDFLPA